MMWYVKIYKFNSDKKSEKTDQSSKILQYLFVALTAIKPLLSEVASFLFMFVF